MFCVFQNETLTNITKEGYGSCYDLGKSLDTTKVGIKIRLSRLKKINLVIYKPYVIFTDAILLTTLI